MGDPATVCVIGSANVDLTFRTPRLPAANETVAATSLQTGCGGKGANQAVMAARCGARVRFVGRVGGDAFGTMLLESLLAAGVETADVGIDPTLPTGSASIVVDDRARNSIVVAAGANGALTADHVARAADSIRAARVVLCQLETPLDATLQAFRTARSAGRCTILNPAPAEPLPDDLLRLTDICVPNETEATLLTGLETDTPEGAAGAARALARRGPPTVIVTLGSRGCLVHTHGDTSLIAAHAVAAVDTTGAGDAFVGALAAALAGGAGLGAAIPRAAAAAALSVTRPGAQSSFPTRPEIDAFIARESAPTV